MTQGPKEYVLKVTLDQESLKTELALLREELRAFADSNPIKITTTVSGPTGNVSPQAPSTGPVFLGKNTNAQPIMPESAYKPSAPPHSAPHVNSAPSTNQQTAQAFHSSAHINDSQQIILQHLNKAYTRINTNLLDSEILSINQINGAARRVQNLSYRSNRGYKPSVQEKMYLENKLANGIGELDYYIANHMVGNNAPSVIAEKLFNMQQMLHANPALQNDKAFQSQLEQVASRNKGNDRILSAHQTAMKQMEMLSTIPTANVGSNFGAYMSAAFKGAKTVLPFVGTAVGIGAFSNAWNVGNTIANGAGQIGMQTGSNPNNVWNTVATLGKSQSFSPTDMLTTAALQGQYSGTGNVALLFKDAMQTAQFTRYLGISQQAGAQILGGYQLNGAFQPGQSAATAHQVFGAAIASGMNTQAFASGLSQIIGQTLRTGVFTNGGPAASLATVSGLGNALHMSLFQGPNAAQSIMTLNQGFSAGPGQGSGMTAEMLLPMYQHVRQIQAKSYAKMGIIDPTVQMASIMASPLSSDPKSLTSVLNYAHSTLSKLHGNAFQNAELAFSNLFFGNIGKNSIQNINQLAGPGYSSAMTHIQNAIHNSGSSEAKQQTNYLHSIQGNTKAIESTLQRLGQNLAGVLIPAGGAVSHVLGAAPGVTNTIGMAVNAYSAYNLMKMVRGLRGGGGGGSGGILSGVKGLFTRGGTSAAADVASASAAGSAATDVALATGLETAGVAADSTGIGIPVGVLLGIAGAAVALYAGSSGGSKTTGSNAASTLHKIAKVGESPGFNNFLNKLSGYSSHSYNGGVGTLPGLNIGSPFPGGGTSSNVLPNFVSPKVTSAVQQSFAKKMYPYAVHASHATGLPVAGILGQWAYESAFGTSAAAVLNGNYAGIVPNGAYSAGADSSYAGYHSLGAFTQNYINTINQPRYALARARGKVESAFGMGVALTQGGYDTTNPYIYGSGVAQDSAVALAALKTAESHTKKQRPSAHHNLRKKAIMVQPKTTGKKQTFFDPFSPSTIVG